MDKYEKILLFRGILILLDVSKIVFSNFLQDTNKKKQPKLTNAYNLQKEINEHINRLYAVENNRVELPPITK